MPCERDIRRGEINSMNKDSFLIEGVQWKGDLCLLKYARLGSIKGKISIHEEWVRGHFVRFRHAHVMGWAYLKVARTSNQVNY